ncbi:MAG: hypothetical protein ACPGWM_07195, partial [Flavobacteriales bacterium]
IFCTGNTREVESPALSITWCPIIRMETMMCLSSSFSSAFAVHDPIIAKVKDNNNKYFNPILFSMLQS